MNLKLLNEVVLNRVCVLAVPLGLIIWLLVLILEDIRREVGK